MLTCTDTASGLEVSYLRYVPVPTRGNSSRIHGTPAEISVEASDRHQ